MVSVRLVPKVLLGWMVLSAPAALLAARAVRASREASERRVSEFLARQEWQARLARQGPPSWDRQARKVSQAHPSLGHQARRAHKAR